MMDVDFDTLRQGFTKYLPLGGLVAGVLAVEIAIVAIAVGQHGAAGKNAAPMAARAGLTNAETIGRVLYTSYVYYFQAAGMVLLVAMIGAIVLTLRTRPGVRRQVVSVQNARTAAMAVDMHDLKPGAGA